MTVERARVETVLRAIVHEIRVERVTFMAGSIAYNAFLSLLPLLFLVLALVSAVGSETLEEALVSITRTIVTPAASDLLVEELQAASASISIIGLAVLVWGALRIFRSLDMAFSDIYETQAENTLRNQLTDGVTVLISLVMVVGFVLAVESRIDVTTGPTLGWLLQRGAVFAVLCLALSPMYYLFPDEADMRFIEAVPGIVFASFCLLVLQSLFGIYITYSDPQVQNSVLASIIIFLTWLYFNALVLLVGAAINAVLTNRSAQVQIEPVIGGKPISDGQLPQEAGIPRTTLIQLARDLPTAHEFDVTVDGTPYELPPPERVDADVDTSPLPFINDTGSITLHWRPERDGPARDDLDGES